MKSVLSLPFVLNFLTVSVLAKSIQLDTNFHQSLKKDKVATIPKNLKNIAWIPAKPVYRSNLLRNKNNQGNNKIL